MHHVSLSDVVIWSLAILYCGQLENHLKAVGSNGGKKGGMSSTRTGTELENQYTVHSRYAVESSAPHHR